MRGFLAGALALIALQVLVSSKLPLLGSALAYPGQLAARWVDPSVPLISAAPSSTGGSPGTGSSASSPPANTAAQQGQQIAGIGAPTQISLAGP